VVGEEKVITYKTMSFDQVCYIPTLDKTINFEEGLNSLASEGWELVTSFPSQGYSPGAVSLFVFKRKEK
jgi:hypothetical protein